jgi:TIR domain-containing protein
MTTENRFELPQNIDRYLFALSKLYEQDGNRDLQELIVNGRPRVHEAWTYDNLNGGTDGHALYLDLPEVLFFRIVKNKADVQQRLCEDLNRLHNLQHEFIAQVFLEIEPIEDREWRNESGLLVIGKRTVPTDAATRLWGDNEKFRLFLSHKADIKHEAAHLKTELDLFGISAFVAHEDIHPARAWQDEIEYALATMDGFTALMTPDFHDSQWTDQEVGFAVARNVPMIATGFGSVPYGFIGKFQALRGDWNTAATDITALLLKHDRMFSSYLRALRVCPNWNTGNLQAKLLAQISALSAEQIDRLAACYNETKELHGSYGFNGTYVTLYGRGLVYHLNRLGSRTFTFATDGTIKQIS